MSAPVTVVCGVAGLALGVAVMTISGHLEARHRAGAAADAAALAAADTASGYLRGEACQWAGQVAKAFEAELESCQIDPISAQARVITRLNMPFGTVRERARAGPPENNP